MTQEELEELILAIRCRSSNMAYEYAINLVNGDTTCNLDSLIILNDYIEYLLKYDLTGTNCIDEEEFEEMLEKAKYLSKHCNCNG